MANLKSHCAHQWEGFAVVSIIMALYNAIRTVGENIESVLAQKHYDWELIIVDNASTDSEQKFIQGLRRQMYQSVQPPKEVRCSHHSECWVATCQRRIHRYSGCRWFVVRSKAGKTTGAYAICKPIKRWFRIRQPLIYARGTIRIRSTC